MTQDLLSAVFADAILLKEKWRLKCLCSNLHANVRMRANDREGIESLCRDGRGEAAWGRGWVGGP